MDYQKEGVIRVDMTFGISNESNIKKAKDVLMGILEKHPKVLKDPAPFVGVSELGDSSVNLAIRPIALPANYRDVNFDVYGE